VKLPDPFGLDPGRLEPLLPVGRGLLRVLLDRNARRRRVGLVHPRLEVRGGQVREPQREVAHVALRIEDEHGNPGKQRLLEEHDREAGLARPGHPDDHAVRRQIARVERQLLAGHPRARRIEGRSEEERPLAGHGPSLIRV
jgi:hypothetical protein